MSSEMEFCFFECVCMFYQRGKSKAEYINKQKFRSRIRRSETLRGPATFRQIFLK